MDLLEDISIALTGLKANKMRAILTMLGIIIGIASVVAITTLGDALVVSMNKEMANWVQNKVSVYVTQKNPDEYLYGRSIDEDSLMTNEMINQYQEYFKDRVAATALYSSIGKTTVTENRKVAKIRVSGVNHDVMISEKIKLSSGRFIEDRDTNSFKSVAVVSNKFVETLFPNSKDVLGREIQLTIKENLYTFTIVGIYELKQESSVFSGNYIPETTTMYIPVTVSNQISGSSQNFMDITVLGTPDADLKQLTEDTKKFFNKFYKNNSTYHCEVENMSSYAEQGESVIKKISAFIAVIAAISLLVGGIGVMNIMIVSITERTREIGTRKALGAPNKSIRRQFIVESVIICLIGGAIGVLIGGSLGVLGSHLMNAPVFPSIKSILMAFGFSSAIGIFFGYYPANKAAKMNPIDALRYE